MAKKAFLVGINRYRDPGNDLQGCVNDVLLMSRALRDAYGFPEENITLLTDERATAAGIRNGLGRLVEGAAPGDSLVFHYSGHGAQVRDLSGDETADGLDEIICPHDLDWSDPFTDDALARLLAPVPQGALLTVIMDCCHSGTGLRDPRHPEGRVRARSLAPPDAALLRAAGEGRVGPADRRVPAPSRPEGNGRRRRPFGICAVEGGGVLVAGCRSDQTSADAWIEGAYHGALTYYLWQSLRDASFRTTYRRAVAAAGAALAAHAFDQVPQLEGPRDLLAAPVFGGG